MLQQVWAGEHRKMTVCVDSYESDVMKGRFYNACREMESFDSLIQFLLSVQNLLEDRQMPQSYTEMRKFAELIPGGDAAVAEHRIRRGKLATFEVQILFRQHTSWQGVVIWREQKLEQSFRSVLELILLMNSAVRSMIRDNKNHQIDNAIASGSREGMCSMDQAIAGLFRAGKITREVALEYADNPEQLKRQL